MRILLLRSTRAAVAGAAVALVLIACGRTPVQTPAAERSLCPATDDGESDLVDYGWVSPVSSRLP